MRWIWERQDWPNFTFDAAAFIHLEREFHRNTGLILGLLSSVSPDDANVVSLVLAMP